jgi:putative ABC transport system permease protein
MLKNYFLTALRALRKQKMHASINIIGLSVGIASSIFILLYLHSELTFDKNFPDSENTYRLGIIFTDNQGNSFPQAQVPGGWTTALQSRLNEVNGGMRMLWMGMPASLHYVPDDRIIMTEELFWVEDTFHEIMDFPVVQGDKETALAQPNMMAISESAAQELFGDLDPLNQQITFIHPFATGNAPLELTISAVYKDYPVNTHIRPKYLVNYYSLKPFSLFGPDLSFEQMEEHMFMGGLQAYVQAQPGTNAQVIEDEMTKIIDEILTDNPNLAAELDGKVEAVVRNVEDIHFDNTFPWVTEGSGNMLYVYIFASIALLILIIACINYMNLATARSSVRSKEVGLRKALGSQRNQLFTQFMMESFLMVFIAFLIAILLVLILLPGFNDLAETSIQFTEILGGRILLGMIILFFGIGFISGLYPAFFLSGFETVDVIKGKFTFNKGSRFLREGLIGFQFAMAIILLITSVFAISQLNMMQKSKLNEAGSQILSIRHGGTAEYSKYAAFKNILTQDPKMSMVTFGNHLPRLDYFGPLGVPYRFNELIEDELEWNTFNVDYDFAETFSLTLTAGRNFEVGNAADSLNIIINEAACKALGKSPQEVVGTSISYPKVNGYFNYDYDNLQSGVVIGVVNDFPYQSAYQVIDPLVISPTPHQIDRILYVRLPEGEFQEKIELIERAWKEVYPGIGLDYWFVDDEFNRMYKTEQRVAALSKNFSGLAIFITCIGLFGLASFVTEQKTREIGIRKVMGASNGTILIRLIMIFMRVFMIATLIALPLAYLLTSWWLQNFAIQIPVGWTVFVVSVLALGLLTILTVSYESLKASMADPVKSLRNN